jgi:hypothetical protein
MLHSSKSKSKSQKEEIFNEDSSSSEEPEEDLADVPSPSEEGEVVSHIEQEQSAEGTAG